MRRYPALCMVASIFRFISIFVILTGLGISFWILYEGQYNMVFGVWSKLIVVGGLIGSVIAGIVLYASGDLLRCLMDIEENTRKKEQALPQQTQSDYIPYSGYVTINQFRN